MTFPSKDFIQVFSKKNILIFVIGLITGLSIALLICHFWKDQLPENPSIQESREEGYRYISPLLECEAFSISDSILTKKTTQTINLLIKNYQDQGYLKNASVYFRDLNNGPWFVVNEEETFNLASLFKVPILVAYLKQAETNPETLTIPLTLINNEEIISQEFNSASPLEKGKEYTTEKLLTQLIVDSDNSVLETLVENIGQDYLEKTEGNLGLKYSNPANGDYTIKVKDYSSVFRRLYNASYLNNEMSEKALEILSRVKFDRGLKAGIPQNVEIAHKFGERTFVDRSQQPLEKELHDCGIIYHHQNPYILCVMTSGNDLLKQASLIKDVSKSVYEMVDTQAFEK